MSSYSQRAAKSMASFAIKRWALGELAAWLSPILVPFVLFVAAVMAVGLLFIAAIASAGPNVSAGSSDTPSALAQGLIPADMLALYQSDSVKKQCPGLSWTIVAAIGTLESNNGQDKKVSPAGAMGPAQFMPATWAEYGIDGNGDGVINILDPADAFPSVAHMLCANGGGNPATLPQAIYNFNHAWWYVYGGTQPNGAPFEGVLPLAKRLAISFSQFAKGSVIVAPGANLPGEPIKPETMDFLQTVAGIYGKPLVCTTGTNHSYLTVDGAISDHASGHACDFGMAANGGTDDSPVGDAIATACLEAAGYSAAQASQDATKGGLFTISSVPGIDGPMRVQCIWKTFEGGNHHNHVHIGAAPA